MRARTAVAQTETVEHELTYRITKPELLVPVLKAVWPNRHILDVEGITFILQRVNLKTGLHFYTSGTAGDYKRRVKIIRGPDKRLKCTLEEKRWADRVKLETRLERATKPRDILAFMATHCRNLLAAFVKERLLLTYAFRLEDKREVIRIGVDKFIAFNPCVVTDHGSPIYDLEVEDNGSTGGVKMFIGSDLFKKHLQPRLQRVGWKDNKWRLSKTYCDADVPLEWQTYEQISDYVDRALQLLSLPDEGPMVYYKAIT